METKCLELTFETCSEQINLSVQQSNLESARKEDKNHVEFSWEGKKEKR